MIEKIKLDLLEWGKNYPHCPFGILIYLLQFIYDETGEEVNDVKKFCEWFNDTWNMLSGELTNEIWIKSGDGRILMANNYIVLKRIFEIIKNIFSLNKSFKYFAKNYNIDVVTTWDTGKDKIYPFYYPVINFEK